MTAVKRTIIILSLCAIWFGGMLTGFSVAGIGGELLSGIVSAIVLVVVSLATQPKKTAA